MQRPGAARLLRPQRQAALRVTNATRPGRAKPFRLVPLDSSTVSWPVQYFSPECIFLYRGCQSYGSYSLVTVFYTWGDRSKGGARPGVQLEIPARLPQHSLREGD